MTTKSRVTIAAESAASAIADLYEAGGHQSTVAARLEGLVDAALLHLADKEQSYAAADDTGKPRALSVPYSDPYAAYAECQRLQGVIDGMREGLPARDAEMREQGRREATDDLIGHWQAEVEREQAAHEATRSELERAKARRDDYESALQSQRERAGYLEGELARRDAVVEAARVFCDSFPAQGSYRLPPLRDAIAALSQPEPAPLSPAARADLDAGLASAKRGEVKPWGDFTQYAEEPRVIVVGSVWECEPDPHCDGRHIVERVKERPDRGTLIEFKCKGAVDGASAQIFRADHTWVSDPSPTGDANGE